MGYAAEVYFDAETEAQIRTCWAALSSAGVGDDLGALGFRPHITLGICTDLPDLAAFRTELAQIAAELLPLDISLTSIGLFPSTALFLAPTTTLPLLKLHQRFTRSFSAAEGLAPLYATGKWVPHSTLTLNLRPDELSAAVEVALLAPLPMHGQLTEIGVSTSRPDAARLRYLLS